MATPDGVRYSTPEPGAFRRTLPQTDRESSESESNRTSPEDQTPLPAPSSSQSSSHDPSLSASPGAWDIDHSLAVSDDMRPSTPDMDDGGFHSHPFLPEPDMPANMANAYGYEAMLHQNDHAASFPSQAVNGGALLHNIDWRALSYVSSAPANEGLMSCQHHHNTQWVDHTFLMTPYLPAGVFNPDHDVLVSASDDRDFSAAHGPTTQEAPMVQNGLNRQVFYDSGHGDLHIAVIYSIASEVERLLKSGHNPNFAAPGGMTPLHYAAITGDLEIISLLEKHGANIDAVSDDGRSVLFFAICSTDRLLGTKVPHLAETQLTSLHKTDAQAKAVIEALFGSPYGWPRLPRSLAKADNSGMTPLMAAAEQGFIRTTTMFLERTARPDAKDHKGYTALKYAVRGDSRDLVRLLLEADERVQNKDIGHMVKLGTRNLPARQNPEGLQSLSNTPRYAPEDYQNSGVDYDSIVLADEMACLYAKMSVLEDVINLARRQGQEVVYRCLQQARARMKDGIS